MAYIYIAIPQTWGEHRNGHPNGFKIGYTARLKKRTADLRYKDGYIIQEAHSIEIKDQQTGEAIEKLTQFYYLNNYKVKREGNDYFKADKVRTSKALREFNAIVDKAAGLVAMMQSIGD